MFPKAPTSGSPVTERAREVGHGEGRVRNHGDRAGVPRSPRAVANVGAVHDERRRGVEHLSGEGEVLRPALPQWRDPLVEHAVGEKAPDDTPLPLHRVEIAVTVAAADREACNEVVQDEVVQHDEARRPSQRVHDPAVRVRIVAYVVDAEICAARRTLAAAPHHLDLDALLQRGDEQRGVVGDARLLRRHRAEVGDLHGRRPALRSLPRRRAARWKRTARIANGYSQLLDTSGDRQLTRMRNPCISEVLSRSLGTEAFYPAPPRAPAYSQRG